MGLDAGSAEGDAECRAQRFGLPVRITRAADDEEEGGVCHRGRVAFQVVGCRSAAEIDQGLPITATLIVRVHVHLLRKTTITCLTTVTITSRDHDHALSPSLPFRTVIVIVGVNVDSPLIVVWREPVHVHANDHVAVIRGSLIDLRRRSHMVVPAPPPDRSSRATSGA
ncbi:hypothetical protein BH11MYX2_BH11MYX2_15420 [soil metagenome]